MWSHGVAEHLLCEVMCLGVRDGAAETLLTEVKVVPETTYLGKSSIGDGIAHIGDCSCFIGVYYIIRFIGNSSSTTRRSTMNTSYGTTVQIVTLRLSSRRRQLGRIRRRCSCEPRSPLLAIG